MNIYIATPYTTDDPLVKEFRFQQAVTITALLMRTYRGKHNFFSPIAHSHLIAQAGCLREDWGAWKGWNKSFLWLWADHLLVPTFCDGWSLSLGVYGEMVQMLKRFGTRPIPKGAAELEVLVTKNGCPFITIWDGNFPIEALDG